jgi:hypothetical protein
MKDETKAVVTVSEMARMVGLSRARFYQLQKAGVFPMPVYDVATRRPIYDEELQKVCLEVRHRNCGINGKPILFYSRRIPIVPTKPRKATAKPPKNEYGDLIDSLQALGLSSVTAVQVAAAIKETFPQGTEGVDEAEVIRAVYLHLRRKNSGDSVGK